MATKLTADFVRGVTERDPPTRETTYFDTVLPRFFLRVQPPRRPGEPWKSSYGVRYSVAGRETKAKVGTPGAMDLDDARKAARKLLAEVETGGNPSGRRAAERAVWTVAEMVEAYKRSDSFLKKSAATQANDVARFKLHIVHHIGGEKIAAVDLPMALQMRAKIERDTRKNAKGRRIGGPGTAKKALLLLAATMAWARREGALRDNPLSKMDLRADGERSVVITTPDEFAALFTTMDDMVAAGELRPAVRAFIVTAAATGARRGELQALRWRQVDLAGCRIELRDTKGSRLARGRPAGPELLLLPAYAAQIIRQLGGPNPKADDLVFSPDRGAKLAVNYDFERVRKKAGLPDGLTPHGLRHSFGTAAAMSGLGVLDTARLLRHRHARTSERYVHPSERHQAQLADRAIGHLMPRPADTVADVVQLPRCGATR
jgi:integrase